ncbi:hypothetical protein [Mycobacterium sp. SMC-4]|uniref:hypothetical protein n=1 Tax=Mycobacterium sp. SMC-4 TaxID=2857059 RepID=UPI0021B46251|nr:hypothetical protein [Mycobacterium sp. SMC-4]UXA19502.1 hypothetical protein KXD98_07855 [Mycobacterium sp. SMC-4]
MTERQGSLMRWMADCGHWMVVYSLEPTPSCCPDCADAMRDAIIHAFDQSAPWIEIEGPGDFDEWFADSGLDELPADLRRQLAAACEKFEEARRLAEEAADVCSTAARDAMRALDKWVPSAERLTMPEAIDA